MCVCVCVCVCVYIRVYVSVVFTNTPFSLLWVCSLFSLSLLSSLSLSLSYSSRKSDTSWLGSHWDVVFLVSSGKMSCYHSGGRLLWQVDTAASWAAGHGDLLNQKVSLQPFTTSPALAHPDAVLAVGAEHLVLIGGNGELLADLRLPGGLLSAPTVVVHPRSSSSSAAVFPVYPSWAASESSLGSLVVTTPDAYIGYEYVPPTTDLLSLLPYLSLLVIVALVIVPISSRSLLRQDTRKAAARKRAVD
jgi:hypothetical protein